MKIKYAHRKLRGIWFYLLFAFLGLLQGCATTTDAPMMPEEEPMPEQAMAEMAHEPVKKMKKRPRELKGCDQVNIRKEVSENDFLICMPVAKVDGKRSYFNQHTNFEIECSGEKVEAPGVESNVTATFNDETANITIRAPRVSADFPDSITVTGLALDKKRHKVKQVDSTKVTLNRTRDDWQKSLGEITRIDTTVDFKQVHHVRPDSPERIWKFDNFYARIIAVGQQCEVRITVGNKKTEIPLG